jgi:hypothetical protein
MHPAQLKVEVIKMGSYNRRGVVRYISRSLRGGEKIGVRQCGIGAAALLMAILASVIPTISAGAVAARPSVPAIPGLLPFSALGLPSSLVWTTSGSSQNLSIPVARGVVAEHLIGTLTVPVDLGAGTLLAESGNLVLASMPLPLTSATERTLNISVPLNSAPVVQGHVNLQLVLSQAGSRIRCSILQPLVFSDGAIQYEGTGVAPTTIASFFPVILSRVDIEVPEHATPAEQQAALNLTVALTESYAPEPIVVKVEGLVAGEGTPWEVPGGEFTRVVYITQDNREGIFLSHSTAGIPFLTLSGSSTTLAKQATLFAGELSQLAVSQYARVDRPQLTPTLGATTVSFGQLGLGGSVTGAGDQQISLGVDASRFGGPLQALKVDLIGEYTPIATGEKGSLTVDVSGVILDSQLLRSSGRANLSFSVPAYLLTRVTTLNLDIGYWPTGGDCQNGGRVITFDVDPSSTLSGTVTHGGVGGFTDLPAAFLPTFEVALDSPTVARLQTAVSIVQGLQLLSPIELRPEVTPLKAAEVSADPVLIVASASRVRRAFDPPLSQLTHQVISVADHPPVVIDPGTSTAALQCFADTAHHRTVLLATTNDGGAALSTLLGWLGNTSQQWESLTGDVLVTAPEGTPINLAVRAGGNVGPVPVSPKSWVEWAAVGVLVVGVCAVAAMVILVARRRRNVP